MLQPYPYQPVGGVNGEDCEDSIGPTEVQDATNILFERKQFQTRPGVTFYHFTSGIAGSFDYAKAFDMPTGIFVVGVNSNGKLYSMFGFNLAGGAAISEITGAGTTLGLAEFHNAAAVNGIILVANNTAGMIRWDPAGTVYTIIGSSDYRYVTSHLTRAVGAYKLSGAAGDPTRIAWSRSGDETLWTGGDSGTANIIDSPDPLTGVGVIHNVLVLPRKGGWHTGKATGVSTPVYFFETFGRDVEGVEYPPTLAFFDNEAYFVSKSDVHSFNLQTITPIGQPIRRELFAYLKAGVKFQGFVSKMINPKPRAKYNLVPVLGAREIPHFIYDIQDHTWSRHTYNFTRRGGFYYSQIPFFGEKTTIALFNSTTTDLYLWDDTIPCEAPASLTGRTITIGFEEKDMILRRLLLKYRNFGPSTIKAKVRAMQNETVVENDDTQQVGTNPADRKLYRKWFNVSLAGNGFEITLESPAGSAFGGNYLGLLWAESGEYKGEPGV